jgi:type VI secretion system protein ImpE
LIPSRYPASEASADPIIRLGRKTEWRELAPDTFVGLGQRMWATDAGEYPMLDTREIKLGGTA